MRLLPDEILSSWLCRSALKGGTDPIRFASALWPGSHVWCGDFDREPGSLLIRSLSMSSGISEDHLHQTSLEHWTRRWTARDISSRRAWPWVVPIGARGVTRSGPAQFCRECWIEDRSPYYRVHWRFSWSIACERHRTRFRVHCPKCSGPPMPHRLECETTSLATCATCGHDLREGIEDTAVPQSILELQAAATEAALDGSASWWGVSLDTTSWMSTLRFWIGIIRQGLRETQSPTSSFVRAMCPELLHGPAGNRFDAMTSVSRMQLMGAAASIRNLDPNAAIALATEHRLTRRHLAGWEPSASSFAQWVSQLPAGTPHRKTDASTSRHCRYRFGQPRPPREIKAMHRRLLRELGKT